MIYNAERDCHCFRCIQLSCDVAKTRYDVPAWRSVEFTQNADVWCRKHGQVYTTYDDVLTDEHRGPSGMSAAHSNYDREQKLVGYCQPVARVRACEHIHVVAIRKSSSSKSSSSASSPHSNRGCANCRFPKMLRNFTARCYEERGIATGSCPSVHLSVCPSVTSRYRDHMGWNTSKIISWLINRGCSLNSTRSQAVARIAGRTASLQAISDMLLNSISICF